MVTPRDIAPIKIAIVAHNLFKKIRNSRIREAEARDDAMTPTIEKHAGEDIADATPYTVLPEGHLFD